MAKNSLGNIILRLTKGGEPEPIFNAAIIIGEGESAQTLLTDTDGRVDFTYDTPPTSESLDSVTKKRPYSVCDIKIYALGMYDIRIVGCQIFPEVNTILNCEVLPNREKGEVKKQTIRVPVHRLWAVNLNNHDGGIYISDYFTNIAGYLNDSIPTTRLMSADMPEFITVHAGKAGEEAPNIKVGFPEYIKNIASSTIYPTWPDAALRANILAIISIAKNRISTGYYHSLGYDFDIAVEQNGSLRYCDGRMLFEPLCRITDELLNCYIATQDSSEPLHTSFCDGITINNDGLSQWGSVNMALKGKTRDEILKNYYGDDIFIKTSEAKENNEIFKEAIKKGSVQPEVKAMQQQLNHIAVYYPLIPIIREAEGSFGACTEAAVKAYQRYFKLPINGVIDSITWHSIIFVSNTIEKYAESSKRYDMKNALNSVKVLIFGDIGSEVLRLQHSINSLSRKLGEKIVPTVCTNGNFDDQTRDSINAFQMYKKIPLTGAADKSTRNLIIEECGDFAANSGIMLTEKKEYPGEPVVKGSEGENVTYIQNALNAIKILISCFNEIEVDGLFGEETHEAVMEIQTLFGLTPDGVVEERTWRAFTNESNVLDNEYLQMDITAEG